MKDKAWWLIAMGLSPRVRGSLGWSGAGRWTPGSIPACAGEPGRAVGCRSGDQVYPRVCGGAHACCGGSLIQTGLSPRVRGSPRRPGIRSDTAGSIPACAGEPRRPSKRRAAGRVYPRVCGGARWRRSGRGAGRGLSPRVRGSPILPGRRLVRIGSIPACAGEPSASSTLANDTRVYPRVCGGALGDLRKRITEHGLSPRVRGSRWRPQAGQDGRGSIPACAGEPPPPSQSATGKRVYPRVCGGASASPGWLVAPSGLSPRVRGSRRIGQAADVVHRSIPACAGEPRPPPGWTSLDPVYPRVCGGARSGRR